MEERRKTDQQKHELLILQMMGNMFIETSNQQQPQQTNTHSPLPYPTTRKLPVLPKVQLMNL